MNCTLTNLTTITNWLMPRAAHFAVGTHVAGVSAGRDAVALAEGRTG